MLWLNWYIYICKCYDCRARKKMLFQHSHILSQIFRRRQHVSSEVYNDSSVSLTNLCLSIFSAFDWVEKYAPGFKASVVGRDILAPPDLERIFGLTGGVHTKHTFKSWAAYLNFDSQLICLTDKPVHCMRKSFASSAEFFHSPTAQGQTCCISS